MINKLLGEAYWNEKEKRFSEVLTRVGTIYFQEPGGGLAVDPLQVFTAEYMEGEDVPCQALDSMFLLSPEDEPLAWEMDKDIFKDQLLALPDQFFKDVLIGYHFRKFEVEDNKLIFSTKQQEKMSGEDEKELQDLFNYLLLENNVEASYLVIQERKNLIIKITE